MIKVYFRFQGKIDNLIMGYTENTRFIENHVQTMFKNASVIKVFLLNSEDDNANMG